ncbi:uncharacterized protein LOC125039783 isoform X2 [Penaeus chinensis]|uniref:uncharacterized protein LOC125039783 isoform X2 n=1 Tax=Penaeus chinensis TaxID=139456 RepID=UPI001FB67E9B|nr:uncharacterized protein LOC125039783 isoform X2 [Penaeus chinensis]
MMDFCLRPRLQSDEESEESLPPSASLLSSPGDSDVFLKESAFGSFNSSASSLIWPQLSPRRLRIRSSSSRSSQVSSSSESDKPSRQGSVKRIVRSLSAILRHSSDGDDLELMLQPTASLLHELGEALLHVYRSNTFPTEGLSAFHQKLTVLVMSGGGASLTGTWRHQVVPTGTRLVAVRVASPRDGDRVAALLTAWSCLYATTLPLLQALLAPFTSLDVRRDVLQAFRDSVLPYAALPSALVSVHSISPSTRWRLKQMLLLLARLEPCECRLPIESQSYEGGTRETQASSRERGNIGDGEEEEMRGEESSSVTRLSHTTDALGLLLQAEMESMNLTRPVLQRLLHLHHGGENDFWASHDLQQRPSSGVRLEVPSLPRPLLVRNLSSVDTLEDLLRSAALR